MDKSLLENNEYTWCFACGKDNEHGLHMRFEVTDEYCKAYFTPRKEHQSYNGRMHGGLVCVLLDEVTGNYLFCKEEKPAYTAKMEIRYRQPLRIDEEVICTGWEKRRKGNMVEMLGKIERLDGTVLAESISKMMIKDE
ncbi:MAG: PaaI family thioesterase [Phascolarctobacterium sp.]|nr:PaaI family thioesterase [Phascolarctobacterium sp.]